MMKFWRGKGIVYKVLGMFGREGQGRRRRRRYVTVPQSNDSIIPMHKIRLVL